MTTLAETYFNRYTVLSLTWAITRPNFAYYAIKYHPDSTLALLEWSSAVRRWKAMKPPLFTNAQEYRDAKREERIKGDYSVMKEQEQQIWVCPRCGCRNSHENEVCMGSEMGDGRCGYPKPETNYDNPR